MSCGGTSAPRRNLGVGGLAVRCAQSRGEWPGSRRTFLEGRLEGERVEVEREEGGGARVREGGWRWVDAVEGVGRRGVERVGRARRVGMGVGFGFRVAVEVGRGGGGIVVVGRGGGGSLVERVDGFGSIADVEFVT